MAARLLDNCAVRITTTGTGSPLTLGAPVDQGPYKQVMLSFADAGATDGFEYAYKIVDGAGWEICTGEWTEATNTITRVTRKSSDGRTVSTDPLSLSGRAFLAVVLSAADFATLGSLQDTIDAMTADAAAAVAAADAAAASAADAAASAATVNPALFLKKTGGETDGAMTGPLNFARATVASHATTAAIWSALGNQINFTGTATVTDFPDAPQAGCERTLICAGACTFTNNANIAVQGAANYTAAAGDIVTVYAMTLSTFRVTIERANGLGFYRGTSGHVLTGTGTTTDPTFQAPLGQPMILLATLTASNSTSLVDTTSLTSTYDLYMIQFENVLPASGSPDFRLRVSDDAGASYKTTGYANNVVGVTTFVNLGQSVGPTTRFGGVNGVIYLPNPTQTVHDKFFSGTIVHANAVALTVAGGWDTDVTAINALQFTFSTVNILSGKVRIWGIKTS